MAALDACHSFKSWHGLICTENEANCKKNSINSIKNFVQKAKPFWHSMLHVYDDIFKKYTIIMLMPQKIMIFSSYRDIGYYFFLVELFEIVVLE